MQAEPDLPCHWPQSHRFWVQPGLGRAFGGLQWWGGCQEPGSVCQSPGLHCPGGRTGDTEHHLCQGLACQEGTTFLGGLSTALNTFWAGWIPGPDRA